MFVKALFLFAEFYITVADCIANISSIMHSMDHKF